MPSDLISMYLVDDDYEFVKEWPDKTDLQLVSEFKKDSKKKRKVTYA